MTWKIIQFFYSSDVKKNFQTETNIIFYSKAILKIKICWNLKCFCFREVYTWKVCNSDLEKKMMTLKKYLTEYIEDGKKLFDLQMTFSFFSSNSLQRETGMTLQRGKEYHWSYFSFFVTTVLHCNYSYNDVPLWELSGVHFKVNYSKF